jgi:hypothetical protein
MNACLRLSSAGNSLRLLISVVKALLILDGAETKQRFGFFSLYVQTLQAFPKSIEDPNPFLTFGESKKFYYL